MGAEWAVTDFAHRIGPHVRGKRVLELGCGTGQFSLLLGQLTPQLTAVDFSAPALSVARRRANEAGLSVEFREADILDLDLGQRFDLVCGTAVLHEVNAPRFDRLLTSIRNHLELGGTCAFLENSGFNPLFQTVRTHLVDRGHLRKVGSEEERPFDPGRWELIRQRFAYAERRNDVFVLFDRAWYQFLHRRVMNRMPRLAKGLGAACTSIDKSLGRRLGNSRVTRFWGYLQTLYFGDQPLLVPSGGAGNNPPERSRQ
jgi:SAM-dependent methyltransferase